MKIARILLLLIACAQTAFSQDLILTVEDVSLNCRITKITNKEIFFVFMQDGVVKDSSLSRQFVKEFKYDKFAVNDTLSSYVPKRNVIHYRVALNGGTGYLMNLFPETPPANLASYYNGLKTGSQVTGDVAYYLSGALGVGVKYSLFNTKNSARLVYPGQIQAGTMSDDMSITFIGPMVSTRFPSINGSNAFLLDFSVGYMAFMDDIVVLDSYSEKGNTIGLSLGLGYDFSFSKNLAMGIQLSMYTGRLTEYVKTDNLGSSTIKLDRETYKKLERLDLSVGLRFMK